MNSAENFLQKLIGYLQSLKTHRQDVITAAQSLTPCSIISVSLSKSKVSRP